MGWLSSIDVLPMTLPSSWPHDSCAKKWCLRGMPNVKKMGGHQTKVFGCTNFNYNQMGDGVSCPHICIKSSNWAMMAQNRTEKCDQHMLPNS
jgi:hypothetical protein